MMRFVGRAKAVLGVGGPAGGWDYNMAQSVAGEPTAADGQDGGRGRISIDCSVLTRPAASAFSFYAQVSEFSPAPSVA